jgi:hypothetical protein
VVCVLDHDQGTTAGGARPPQDLEGPEGVYRVGLLKSGQIAGLAQTVLGGCVPARALLTTSSATLCGRLGAATG